jgi:hypothetical protein
VTAVVAPQAEEPVLRKATAEVASERALHVVRQWACVVLLREADERREVVAHEPVEQCLLGTMALMRKVQRERVTVSPVVSEDPAVFFVAMRAAERAKPESY